MCFFIYYIILTFLLYILYTQVYIIYYILCKITFYRHILTFLKTINFFKTIFK